MIKKILLGGLIILSSSGMSWSQNRSFNSKNISSTITNSPYNYPSRRTCVTSNPPSADLEKTIEQIIKNNAGARNQQTAYTIPVIVHVIHSNTSVGSGANITAAQIQSQIAILNADYGGTGYNSGNVPTAFASLKANTEITFCLAKVDPQGNTLAEPGIERISYQSKGWQAPSAGGQIGNIGYDKTYVDATIKPTSIWNPSKYLNIWLVNALFGGGGDLLGYATFPTMSATSSDDGVVIDCHSFGSGGVTTAPYNRGRTATHEVGHWLGLRHIWGDGYCADDFCTDTPPQEDANYDCPTYPLTAANPNLGWNGPRCSTSDPSSMFMNFMDYVDDACMYMFSNDQKARALSFISAAPLRANIVNSNVCNNSSVIKPVANFSATPTTVSTNTNVAFSDASTNTPTSWQWSATPSAGVTITTPTSQNPTMKFANTGTYTIKLKVCNTAGCDSMTKTAYITVTASSTKPVANFSATPTTVSTNTNVAFTDVSTNGPTSWQWTATPSAGVTVTTPTSQNPIMSFANIGTYTINLKVCNTSGCDSLTKTSYITVTATPLGTCDTIANIPGTAQLVAYWCDSAPYDSGYITGTNAYLDIAKAEKFTGYGSGKQVEGMFIFLNEAKGTGTTNFTIWDANGAGGSPSTALGSTSIPLNMLNASISNLSAAGNYIPFTSPIVLGANTSFFAGFTIPYGIGDTISCYTTAHNPNIIPNSWEQWSDNSWNTMLDSWEGLRTDLIITVKLCPAGPNSLIEEFNTRLTNNVNLFPNPSSGVVNLALTFDEATTVTTKVTNMLGETVFTAIDKNITITMKELNLSTLSKGSYFLTVKTDKGITTKKVVLE